MKKFILLIVVTGLSFSCDFLDPKLNNDRTFDQLFDQPAQITGILYDAYTTIPSSPAIFGGDEFLDVATPNAVTNDVASGLNRIAVDRWTVINNPLNQWNARFIRINSVNQFLEIGLAEEIQYIKTDEARNAALKVRLEGEAYFLRGYHQFEILRRFAGKDASGALLGYPIITGVIDPDNIPVLSRNAFSDCVGQIISDLEKAESLLPIDYSGSTIEFNQDNTGRASATAAAALKARVLLYQASPLYNESNDLTKWEAAATAAKEALDIIGTSLPDIYSGSLDNFYNSGASTELIMRRLGGNNNAYERSMLPPSRFGNGRTNPSQNLVDAFPTASGYPIDDLNSGYDASQPYENRDPRFYATIFYNGANYKGSDVETFAGGVDALGAAGVNTTNASRSGYYLRKWVSEQADIDPANNINAFHYFSLFRKVEVFLNFAEAANEAFGPNGDPEGFGYTAVDAIREVRRRAGISQPDAYLNSIANDQEAMRELIRNERRIELCFENHYFYDIRRWKEPLNTPVRGMSVTKSGINFNYNEFTIYTPQFDESFMYYGPLPFNETLKTPSIVQNAGWQ